MLNWPFDELLWGSEVSLKRSRWVFAIVAGLSLMTMACISFSWQQFSLMLIEGHSYEWKCSPEEVALRVRGEGAACLAQEKATADLFSYLVICQALSGLLAGLVLDHADGRICALCGIALNLLARALTAAATPSFRAYDAAVVLDGLACNLVAFPALALADLFPTHPNFSFAFVLTAEFLGATVTPAMWKYYLGHPRLSIVRLWVGYTLAIALPLGIIFVMIIPPKGTKRTRHKEDSTAVTNVTINEAELLPRPSMAKSTSMSELLVSEEAPTKSWKSQVLLFLRQLTSIQFFLFGGAYCVFMFQHTYYPAVLRDLAGLSISTFQGSFQASQAAWAISLGFLADYISNQAMTLALAVMTCTVFGLILARHNATCQRTAAVIFTIAHSYVFTIRFTFVRESFPELNRGKILGCIGILSAITNAINVPVNRTTRYRLWSFIMMGMSVLQVPFIFFWYRWQRKHVPIQGKHVPIQGKTTPLLQYPDSYVYEP